MLPIILKQHELVDELCKNSVFFKPSKLQNYHNLLNYIADNIELDIYTIHTLQIATQAKKTSDLLEIVRFFSGGNSNLFEIKYCYEMVDNERIDIHQDEYNNFMTNNEVPVNDNGVEIEDFDPKYLSFYCLVNYDEH